MYNNHINRMKTIILPKYGYGGEFLAGGSPLAAQGAQIGTMIAPGIGTAIGAGAGMLLGGLGSVFSAKKRDKQFADQQANAMQLQAQWRQDMKLMMDKLDADNFSPFGNTSFRPFGKYGLRLPKFANGNAMPLAPEASVVQGASHENGGVTVTSPLGTPQAEIEGGEVQVDDMIFSRRLQLPNGLTFADMAAQMVQSPEYKKYVATKAEGTEKRGTMDVIVANEGRHIMETLKNPLEPLFALQEQFARAQEAQDTQMAQQGQPPMGKYGIRLPKYGYGNPPYAYNLDDFIIGDPVLQGEPIYPITTPHTDDVTQSRDWQDYLQSGGIEEGSKGRGLLKSTGSPDSSDTPKNPKSLSTSEWKTLDIAGKLVPFADNIMNMVLTNKIPAPSAPILDTFIPGETNVNIDASLNEIRSLTNAANKGINSSIVGGGAADNRKRANLVVGINARNRIIQDAQNQEMQLRNNNRAGLMAVNASNNAKLMDFNNQINGWQTGKLSETSNNVVNATEDATQSILDSKNFFMDKLALEMLMKKYKATGVLDRNAPQFLKDLFEQSK